MQSESIYEEDYLGYKIKIFPDTNSEDPRKWDNVGTMVCWHSRYNLGDEQPKETPVEYLCGLLGLDSGDYMDSRSTLQTLVVKMTRDYIILPLYIYEHSGITISTSTGYPYNDRWDAGQVGFIYVTKERAVAEWGKKLFTKTVEEKTVKYLRGEVETYDNYLTGNVYGYQVCDEDDEVLDSCWGYYPDHGEHPDYNGCLESARSQADWYAKERKEEQDASEQRLAIAQAHE
jgi:hypothetical protein